MRACLGLAISILTQPREGWHALRRSPPQPATLLSTFAAVLLPIPALFRLLGHQLLRWPARGLLVDALYYPGVLLLLLLALAWLLGSWARRLQRALDPGDALGLALLSSTALWLSGLLYVFPWTWLQASAPTLGLLVMGYSLFMGLQVVLGLSPHRALPVATGAMAGFVAAFVVFAQVLPLLLFAR